ncbi:methylmalonyl Co-A mutase-associated GTPase MeaB [Fictibacillus fluitans]|uniref:Methylmalonyl Co-A mutase-associated GTPase MeaB n=1 Tax=Fictibacillus fluitans TaxID=3058422 RepID=A0ABT8HVE7_9BACL|nr:methylmalonyl Co-A mutase-associated GTPase MeaB [Fictibacillus sp. NE201]MDN4524757.1 methylmalonyl Co-A mutase-associated GTPase MeaB [Fictibacillus sp. NE201]
MHPLAERIQNKDERALARAISYVENDHPEKLDLLKDIHAMQKKAHYVGLTGSPGAGKSSLVNRLITYLRSLNLTVGVVAVDPTSPFSGGAILGDRVRMSEHFTDPDVFIRSMGTRGSLGGLARTTKETVRLMDAFGFDVILIETVGVGQSELDIMKIADSIAVVLNPGSGDVVQVFKAGIMEIADLFIVNKADLPGVPKLLSEIDSMLDLVKHDAPYRPPVVQTISVQNKGLEEVWGELISHRAYLEESGEGHERRARSLKQEVIEVVHYELMRTLLLKEEKGGFQWVADVQDGSLDPYTAAEEILERWNKNQDGKE